MIHFLRKITPKWLRWMYHRVLARIAALYYRNPSDKMVVIGVTGTSGKSTTSYMLTRILENAGYRVGLASTIMFKVGKKEWLNDKKMTMVGRFELQRLLAKMASANCQYVVVETTSEGIVQSRHIGINYDVAVFTNLYPEHIESHGSFENYKAAKLKLFSHLESSRHKLIHNQRVPKVVVANLDDEHATDFLNVKVDHKFGYSVEEKKATSVQQVIRATSISKEKSFIDFAVDQTAFRLHFLGEHNVSNALAAITVAKYLGISLPKISDCLSTVYGVPGRLELISEGQPFTVIVDYAFEPRAMTKLYDAVENLGGHRIIHVLGGTGGGRDRARRAVIGELAGTKADVVIITNEDPYDEDPWQIMEDVVEGVRKAGKNEGVDYFMIEDRAEAITKAVSIAQEGDVVLITGKGSEQAIVVEKGEKIPWDDREIAREAINNVAS